MMIVYTLFIGVPLVVGSLMGAAWIAAGLYRPERPPAATPQTIEEKQDAQL